MKSNLDEEFFKKEQDVDDKLTDIAEYIENQQFQRIIARYQILLSILLAMFAFFLGAGNYYFAGTFAAFALVIYWIYEREWDRIKAKHGKMVYEQDARRINRSHKNERNIKKRRDEDLKNK